jgi:hypothetical protein
VIPVLIDNVEMPQADKMPESLAGLAYRQAIPIRPPPDFNHDIEKLARHIEGQDKKRLQQAALKLEDEEQQRQAAEKLELDRQREAARQREAKRKQEAEQQQDAKRKEEAERQEAERQRQLEAERQREVERQREAERQRREAEAAQRREADAAQRRRAQEEVATAAESITPAAPARTDMRSAPDKQIQPTVATSRAEPRITTPAEPFVSGAAAAIAADQTPTPGARLKELGLDSPSLALVLGALFALTVSLFYLVIDAAVAPYAHQWNDDLALHDWLICYWWLNILYYAFVAFAGMRMRSFKNYRLAAAGSLLAILPVSPLFVLMGPLGVWCRSGLKRSDVRAAFEAPDSRLAETKLDNASLGLIIAGFVTVALSTAVLALGLSVMNRTHVTFGDGFPRFAYWLMNVLYYGFVAFAGVRMRRFRNYKIAVAGSVMAVLPVSPFFVVLCPFGIWALKLLKRPEISDDFQR